MKDIIFKYKRYSDINKIWSLKYKELIETKFKMCNILMISII